MNAYSFYLYGSPFFWFSMLFPQRWLPYLMVPLLVLKFGVAGGGAYLYLKRYVKNWDYAVLGACLYALSGFAVYNVFFNHLWMWWRCSRTCCGRWTRPCTTSVTGCLPSGGGEPAQQLLLFAGQVCSWPSTSCASSLPATTA